MASVVTGEDTASKAADHADGRHEGFETMSDGTGHFWSDFGSTELNEHYDHYWYTNGTESWTYEGSYWHANGNGWQYKGDSTGFWDYLEVDLDSSTDGWEYYW